MSDQELVVVEETTEALAAEETATEMDTKPEDLSQDVEKPSIPEPDEVAGTVFSEEETDESEADEPESGESESDDLSIYNLRRGQHLRGVVKNITEFGAFIDLGIAQDGLVHISELARRKVEQVTDVVAQGQEVEVWVKKVDKKRGRISLTMIKPVTLKLKDIVEESELEGTVTRLESYGAFVDIGSDRDGLVHISQITHDYIKHPEDVLAVGNPVQVKVLKVNRKKRQVDLSIKALLPPPVREVQPEIEAFVPSEPVYRHEVTEEAAGEDEPMPTAMAIAYAALQGEGQGKGKDENPKDKRKRRRDMEAIVARTLANREK